MRISAFIFLFFISYNTFASSQTQAECKMTSGLRQSLEVIGLNIANHQSTRTSEGGSYIPKEVKCTDGKCIVVNSKLAPMLMYKPGHPDANKEGYVAYPNIDLALEKSKFQLTAERLIALAKAKKCGMYDGLSSSSFISIYYSKNADQADVFVKNPQGEIIIWESMAGHLTGSVLNLINGSSSPIPLPGDYK